MNSLLAAAGLSKSYGGVRVLDDVSLEVRAGEIHALVGENGAGKSTLIKIIGGAVRPDSGEVLIGGAEAPPYHNARKLPLGDPLAIRRLGVSLVYQEFTLVPSLSVAANVFLGRERGRPLLDGAGMQRAAQALLDELGVPVRASDEVAGLSVAQQQMVEIARALVDDAKVIILDEPSATLSAPELARLFSVLRRLRARGLGLIYISHRLEEIFALADRVTVLRDGRHVVTTGAQGLDRAQLIRWMVGRDLSEEFPTREAAPGEPVLEVRSLSSPPRFSDASFTVRRGEIVGLAGLVGAGRTSAGLALAGAIPSSGTIRLGGRDIRFRSPDEAIRGGLAYVTEDRKGRGIFPAMSTGANITLTHVSSFSRAGLLSLPAERAAAEGAARAFGLRTSSLGQPIGTLSGGNQQKALLARYVLNISDVRVLVLDEPTRGVDVGARGDIYRLMNRLTAGGLGILMISSDLPEVLGMSDRVVVMRQGRTMGELGRAEATPERVMALAALGA